MNADDVKFLREMARDVIEASRVRPGESVGASPKNSSGITLIRPGGRVCYPAMWVRDFSMSLDCGLISPKEILEHLKFIARSQNGATERRLKSGAIIPPHAIPDHINFDGGAVFYPGTYSAGEDQGGEPFGVLPPADDHYEFVHIAHHLWKSDPKLATEFLPSLIKAFDAPKTDVATGGMVTTTPDRRAVGYGFYDAIFLTGAVLFPSLMRWRAANELAEMTGDKRFVEIASSIASHIEPIFSRDDGWLNASTDIGRQPDIWGTIYAVHLGLLNRKRTLETIADAKIYFRGAVKHSTAPWPKVAPGVAPGRYQNGAYWHTATGWYISALMKIDPDRAEKVFKEFIDHLRDEDFRKGEKFGAPWECISEDGNANQNPVYMASVTVPLSVIEKL